MKVLLNGFHSLALSLQEAATALSHDDIRKRVAQGLDDKHKGSGEYAYPIDIFGDDQSGDVVYSSHGGMKRAKYSMSSPNGAPHCEVDCENAEPVIARTSYEKPADDDDHMNAMESEGLYLPGPENQHLYERFISKDERSKMDKADFAGKGTSFPIKNQTDVDAAFHALGRAGANNLSRGAIRRNIIAIAKRKGLTLPKSAQDEAASNSGKEARGISLEHGEMELRESATFCQAVPLKESAKADYAVKLIGPGWGSSGYYAPAVLERDGSKVFRSGTHMYWNHATDAEESARPEGDLNNLAAVLTTDAYYDAAGKEGAGLYARAKVFSDYADKVAEKAPHTGLSIRAAGKARTGEAEGRKGPIIEALTHGESVDFVTKAGAKGKVLTEAARSATTTPTEGADMDAAELKRLQESVARLETENKKFRERGLIEEARGPVADYFATVMVSPMVANKVWSNLTERFVSVGVPTKDGAVDVEAVKKFAEAETKSLCSFIESVNPTGRVLGMGAPVTDPKEAEKSFKEASEKTMGELATIMFGDPADATSKAQRNRIKRMHEGFRKGRAA